MLKNYSTKNNLVILILGIDPGTKIMGYCLIKEVKNKISLLIVEELVLKNIANTWLKSKEIFSKTLFMIDKYQPKELAIESPFPGKKSIQSMFQVERAQNIAISAGLYRNLSITEYHPKKIKLIIANNGNATKKEIAKKIADLFTKEKATQTNKAIPRYDCTDAIAVALCHLIIFNYSFFRRKSLPL
ncbi:crossover junction endodeoxyribonuclease RuvC [Candidatus Karelsulcia muelleri]